MELYAIKGMLKDKNLGNQQGCKSKTSRRHRVRSECVPSFGAVMVPISSPSKVIAKTQIRRKCEDNFTFWTLSFFSLLVSLYQTYLESELCSLMIEYISS